MADRELNFDAPLLSTRRLKKTAVTVRRNMANKLTDDSNTSESHSVPVLVQDMGLDLQVLESASVPLKLQDAVNGNLTRLDSSKDKEEEEAEESEDDDVFSDARDTLSVKHSVTTSPRPSEDFMLNRFLPAAKSMTVEQQPQYALNRRSLPVMSEPMRHIKDIVPAKSPVTPTRYESITTPPYFQGIDYEESEYDEDDDEVSEYLSKRGCGMMSPQLCFKNSLGMLSSVHGLKDKPYSLRTSSYDQAKPSKVAQLKSRFQSVKKLALKLGSRARSPLHPSGGKKFNFGSEQLESNMSTASMPSSPYRQTGYMSPYRTSGIISPLHPAGFPGTRKEAETMRANRLNKHIRNNINSQELLYPKSTRVDCSTSSVMEKTLYVDTENCPNTSNDKRCDLSPLVPPPPKKPSDSWLFRNLPSVSSKISSRRYLLHPQNKSLEENSTSVTKWETIVKTSCMHRDHIRYSEELVARSSCQSKT